MILPNIGVNADYAYSKDCERILYQCFPNGDLKYKIYSGKSEQEKTFDREEINKEEWFYNFNIFYQGSFQDSGYIRNYDNSINIVVKDGDLIALKPDGRRKILLSGKEGYNKFKEFHFSCANLAHSYFLPGNRYFTTYIFAKNLSSQVICDSLTGKFMLIPNIVFFFNISSDDIKDFTLRGYEILNPNGLIERRGGNIPYM